MNFGKAEDSFLCISWKKVGIAEFRETERQRDRQITLVLVSDSDRQITLVLVSDSVLLYFLC